MNRENLWTRFFNLQNPLKEAYKSLSNSQISSDEAKRLDLLKFLVDCYLINEEKSIKDPYLCLALASVMKPDEIFKTNEEFALNIGDEPPALSLVREQLCKLAFDQGFQHYGFYAIGYKIMEETTRTSAELGFDPKAYAEVLNNKSVELLPK